MTTTQMRRIRGQGMSEYIIITALIAVAGIGVFAMFGDTLSHQVASMSTEMAGQDGAASVTNAQTAAGDARNRADQSDNLSNYTTQSGSE